jgi:LysM repeat protein
MRTWTKSACVVLAWSVLSIILVAIGLQGSAHHPAQANTRTASSTEVTLTSILSAAAASVTATSHTMRYVVQPGDTLSGIANRFAVRGGWPALYAANRHAIGPDPDVIHSGTVLVLPSRMTPVRYTVAAGDTLSGIAAEFAVRGGWPALYAANRHAIGPDPDVINSGTVLTIPRPAASSAAAPGRALRRQHPPAPPPSPAAPSSRSAGLQHQPLPAPKGASVTIGMPRWLKTVLLVVGLLILVAFLTEPVLVVRRRRQRATAQETKPSDTTAPETTALETTVPQGAVPALQPGKAGSGPGACYWRPGACRARIVLADYDRVVVTRSRPDDTVYVLRPPGEDPRAILRVARLVLPEGPYGELAKQLGMPAIGPVE